MKRTKRITVRVDPDERRLAKLLANKLERSQSDAIRWLIRNAARQLEPEPEPHHTKQLQPSRFHIGVSDDLT